MCRMNTASFLTRPHRAASVMRLENFPIGVTVVTANALSGPTGMTVNSFSSVLLDLPLVLWSPAKTSTRHNVFVGAANFAIHILDAEQDALCSRFTRGGVALRNWTGSEMRKVCRSFRGRPALSNAPRLRSTTQATIRSLSAVSFAQHTAKATLYALPEAPLDASPSTRKQSGAQL